MLVLVRGSEDLARACSELSDFFAIRQRQRDHAPVPETLLGIWVGPGMAAEVPSVLTSRTRSAAGWPVQIRETVGLSGIWTICWLETPRGEGRDDLSRFALLGSLIESADQGEDGVSPGRFAPVFRGVTAPSEVQAEMRSLQEPYSHHLLTPLFQNPVTGRLSHQAENRVSR